MVAASVDGHWSIPLLSTRGQGGQPIPDFHSRAIVEVGRGTEFSVVSGGESPVSGTQSPPPASVGSRIALMERGFESEMVHKPSCVARIVDSVVNGTVKLFESVPVIGTGPETCVVVVIIGRIEAAFS